MKFVRTIDELRREAGASDRAKLAMAAIDGAATLCGGDIPTVMAALWAAYMALCLASDEPLKMLTLTETLLAVARHDAKQQLPMDECGD